MSLDIDFDRVSASAVIRRDADPDTATAWAELSSAVQRIDGAADVGPSTIRTAWSRFLLVSRTLSYLRRRDRFELSYSDEARWRLQQFARESRLVAEARSAPSASLLSAAELREKLEDRGWDFKKRELTEEQVRDVRRMSALSHGANFSVPGAGKTTVALAVHLASVEPRTHLLVVSPKNAFPAWDEVLAECLSDPVPTFRRLVGGAPAIRSALGTRPLYAIVGYSQLPKVVDDLIGFMIAHPTHLVLDESHRIKSGHYSQTGSAALSLSPFPVRRDILSGTPLPNSFSDLTPQFDFLWSGQGIGGQIAQAAHPRDIIGSLYVRTTKKELHLPAPIVDYRTTEMSDGQRVLYGILRNDLLRQRGQLGRSLRPGVQIGVMRLLQAAIDPQAAALALLSADDGRASAHDLRTVCQVILDESISPRLAAAISQVRELTAEKKKVVVWVPFVHTVTRLERELEDLGAVAIHGGVPAGDELDDDTREGILRRFHNDSACLVLIANPAAGGEGISLHRVCHDAIYVGRTYNAAHFLQSRDRIHRLGLSPDTETHMTIYESTAPAMLGSVDLSVRNRLDTKVRQMAQALDDFDLRTLALESDTAEAFLDDGLSFEDLEDLFDHLTGGASNSV
jgi:hypothetical protein